MNTVIKKSSAGRIADTPTFVLSAESIDRHGDIVIQRGWKLDNFNENPVALVSHNRQEMPIGIWKNLRVQGDALLGDLHLAARGTSRAADLARGLIEQGILRAVSVSFRALKAEPMKPYGMKFHESELLEVSLVSVPAHPRAVMVAKSLNMTEDEMKTFFEMRQSGDDSENKAAELQAQRYKASKTRAIAALVAATRAQRKRGEL